jgi:hypothetical protein
MEAGLSRSVSGGAHVSHVRTWEKERSGRASARKELLKWRIRPIAERLGIPSRLITFQVMRRSLGTHLSGHGTLKDTQGALRHASITTTGNVYVQVVEENVMRAVNSHATTVLEGWIPQVGSLRQTGRNIKRLPEPMQALEAIRRSLTRFRRGGLASV